MIKNLTIVIPNFKREQYLRRAICSALAVNPEKLIVSSFRTDPNYIEQFEKEFPIESYWYDVDLGLNELWLMGIEKVGTPYVMILHDDDYYNLDMASDCIAMLTDCMTKDNIDLGVFDGILKPENRIIKSIRCEPEDFIKQLMTYNSYSLSPVVGIFRTKVVRDSLIEARKFTDSVYYPTGNPNQLVGNDLLIWLNAVTSANRIKYISEPCICYQRHDGSITTMMEQRGVRKLFNAYDKVRDYFNLKRESK